MAMEIDMIKNKFYKISFHQIHYSSNPDYIYDLFVVYKYIIIIEIVNFENIN